MDEIPKIGMVIIGPSHIGGAEKRYANVFKFLRKTTQVHLLINESRFHSLNETGVFEGDYTNINIIKIRLDKNKNSNKIQKRNKEFEPSPKKINPITEFLRKIKTSASAHADFFMIWLKIEKWRKNEKMDVLHGVFQGVFALTPYYFFGKTPTVISYNDSCFYLLDKSFLFWFQRFRIGLRYATQVDLLSNFIYQGIKAKGIVIEPDRLNISNISFIDVEKFQPSFEKEDSVIFCGRLQEYKNPGMLVEASVNIIKKYPKIRFYILGEGPLEIIINTQIEELNLSPYFTLMHTLEPAKYLSKSKIFVSLQETNNFPSQSLMEAMACENAVVATDVGDTRMILDETVGILIPVNSESLSESIIYLLDNPEKMNQMGKNARKRIVNDFSEKKFMEYIHNVYLKAVSRFNE